MSADASPDRASAAAAVAHVEPLIGLER
ncbi:MAG: hypothetical protein QOD73_1279, partial [Solirubrobacteraceae bacterium]|nr:hypothetical protein [Solirubrobacteraceae bacterium]